MLERTDDVEMIRRIVTNPRCWRWVGAGDPDSYTPVIHPDLHYLTWGDGLFAFKRLDGVLYEVHAFAPDSATAAQGRAALEWMRSNTDARKVFAMIPAYKRHAVKYASSVGFSFDGRLSDAVWHRGRLHDMILLGVSLWAAQ